MYLAGGHRGEDAVTRVSAGCGAVTGVRGLTEELSDE
jgi:hypothetical protein